MPNPIIDDKFFLGKHTLHFRMLYFASVMFCEDVFFRNDKIPSVYDEWNDSSALFQEPIEIAALSYQKSIPVIIF